MIRYECQGGRRVLIPTSSSTVRLTEGGWVMVDGGSGEMVELVGTVSVEWMVQCGQCEGWSANMFCEVVLLL